MLHNRGQAHGKGSCQVRNRGRSLAQPDNDRPSSWVRQRLENRIKLGSPRLLGLLIVKHILKYRRNDPDVKSPGAWQENRSVRRREVPASDAFITARPVQTALWCNYIRWSSDGLLRIRSCHAGGRLQVLGTNQPGELLQLFNECVE